MIVLITAHGNERIAVDAMKLGAFDYLAKFFEIDELRLIARNAARQIQLRQENRRLKTELEAATGFGEIVGQSQAMKTVFSLVEKVAEADVTVLLNGESGCGKELVVREIHRRSPRSGEQLVTVNCAAIPENLIKSELFDHQKGSFTGATQGRLGKFEQAAEGTLSLDEIGDLPLETQSKILRALKEKRVTRVGGSEPIDVDVRIISATNRDLLEMVDRNEFRQDFYYRLEVVQIPIAPLRSRREDIPLLIEHFLRQFARKHEKSVEEVSPKTLQLLID